MDIKEAVLRNGDSVEVVGVASFYSGQHWLEPPSISGEYRKSGDPPSPGVAVKLIPASNDAASANQLPISGIANVIGVWQDDSIAATDVRLAATPAPQDFPRPPSSQIWDEGHVHRIYAELLEGMNEWKIYAVGKGADAEGRPVVDAWSVYVTSSLADWAESVIDGALRLNSWLLPRRR